MNVKFFTESGNVRAIYKLNDAKWPELEDLMRFVKRLIPLERAGYAVFEFNGSTYVINRKEVSDESSTSKK